MMDNCPEKGCQAVGELRGELGIIRSDQGHQSDSFAETTRAMAVLAKNMTELANESTEVRATVTGEFKVIKSSLKNLRERMQEGSKRFVGQDTKILDQGKDIVKLQIDQATMATAGQVKKAAWGTAFTILGIAIAAVVMMSKVVAG